MSKLNNAGLTENESKIYLALIDLGPSLAGTISRKTGIHRRTIYDTTERLIEKGLISYILRNNRRLFQASNPQRFLDIIHEKELALEPIVEELQEKYRKTKEKEETNFYRGKEGLKSVFEDQLNSKEILVIGASQKPKEVLRFYLKWYDKARIKKKIKMRVIAHDKKIKIPFSDTRFLPKKYASPMAINIYGNKTAIIHWANNPQTILIKSKEIADGYRNYSELLWKLAKK